MLFFILIDLSMKTVFSFLIFDWLSNTKKVIVYIKLHNNKDYTWVYKTFYDNKQFFN